jgi:hypothetical protein
MRVSYAMHHKNDRKTSNKIKNKLKLALFSGCRMVNLPHS